MNKVRSGRCLGCLIVITEVRLREAESALHVADRLFKEKNKFGPHGLVDFARVKINEAADLFQLLELFDGTDEESVEDDLRFIIGDLLHRYEQIEGAAAAMGHSTFNKLNPVEFEGPSIYKEVASLMLFEAGYSARFGADAVIHLRNRIEGGLPLPRLERCYRSGMSVLAESVREQYDLYRQAIVGVDIDFDENEQKPYPMFDEEMKDSVANSQLAGYGYGLA